MNLIKNNLKSNFGLLPNELINDFSISPVARCLFAWMAAQADGFKFNRTIMMKAIQATSKKTIAKYVKELEAKGWISRVEVREKGVFQGFEYTIHATPTEGQSLPHGKKTDAVKNRRGKNAPLNKTKDLNNTNTPLIPQGGEVGNRDLFSDGVEVPLAPPKTAAPPPRRKKTDYATDARYAQARQVIDFLRSHAKRQFGYGRAYVTTIQSRIDEGLTLEDCFNIVRDRTLAWNHKGHEMRDKLNPQTLFRPCNYEKYLNSWNDRQEAKSSPQATTTLVKANYATLDKIAC